ncbi:MAG: class I SAM-dependent methyltransferase [Leptolyngbya sp. SIO1D8]|nr:class I SAM-dependent methyltransferase [Leptolyngbya sp. SIO1D8]
MKSYQEEEKRIARLAVLEEAIKCLTEDRDKSTVASKDYVRNVHQYIYTNGDSSDRKIVAKLSQETIVRWESFYDSITQRRRPENLKVAYLSGPNPENDLQELMNFGVLPENVWAFETDPSTYEDAVWSTLGSEFPFLKLIKGNISQFFNASPQKFDIIYLDFCGPFPSGNKKQKTLATIASILTHHAINSPGVLITNFSLPNKKQDGKGLDVLTKLVASYLYPKSFLETKDSQSENFTEGPIASDYKFDDWLSEVRANMDFYYGQYITRLLIDLASIIVPYDNFPRKSGLFEQFFNLKDKAELKNMVNNLYHFSEDESGGSIIIDHDLFPILWTIASLHKSRNFNDQNYPQLIYQDAEYEKFCNLFLRQLSFKDKEKEVIENLEFLHFLLSDFSDFRQASFYSDKLKNLAQRPWHFEMPIFCDLVLFHQIKELLFRQLAVPYHVNIERTKRWTYLAKETRMFMDMTVLDECRYVYDWMPTIDMIEAGMDSIDRQLCYRFALDALGKNRRWYNNEYFYGTAVVDQFKEGFRAKILEPRIVIN